jgi:hypothetical protein
MTLRLVRLIIMDFDQLLALEMVDENWHVQLFHQVLFDSASLDFLLKC